MKTLFDSPHDNWLTPAATAGTLDFLGDEKIFYRSGVLNMLQDNIEALVQELRSVFTRAPVTLVTNRFDEISKHTVEVDTGDMDLDARYEIENQFYARVQNQPQLADSLKQTYIRFL